MTPIERMAKAMEEATDCESINWDALARVALAAIAEPSDKMVEAGQETGERIKSLWHETIDPEWSIKSIWRAMHRAMMEDN